MTLLEKVKTVAAVVVVVGIVVGYVNQKFAPHALLLESSPGRPTWLPWLGWALTSLASLAYIAADYFEQ